MGFTGKIRGWTRGRFSVSFALALVLNAACGEREKEADSPAAPAAKQWQTAGAEPKKAAGAEQPEAREKEPEAAGKSKPTKEPAAAEAAEAAGQPTPRGGPLAIEADKAIEPAEAEKAAPGEKPPEPAGESAAAPPVEPPVERAPPPVETVLKPGTLLVYSFAGYIEDQDGIRMEKGFLKCTLKGAEEPPDKTAFSAACSEIDRVAMSPLDPIWEGGTVYAWEKHGVSEADGQTPLFPLEPEKYEFTKALKKLNGQPAEALCYETPETDEPGDSSGQTRCVNPAQGLVFLRTWTEAGWVDEEDFRLVEAVTDHATLTDPGRKSSEAKAKEMLAGWVDAQNRGDFGTYSGLYDDGLEGVKRARGGSTVYNREGWLKDRGRMFKRPMKVEAEDAEFHAEPDRVTVVFLQHWSTGKYADWGPKLMVISTSGKPKIVYEEMLWSKQK